MKRILRLSLLVLACLSLWTGSVFAEKCNTDEDCGSVTRYRLCKSGSCTDCSSNSDCDINEGDECKNDGHCQMLSFFGNMGVREVFAMIAVSVGAVIAAGGGLGGGGIFVPVFILILGFNTKAAAALSQATIFGGSLVNLYMNFQVTHPIRDHRTLADLNTILILEPMLLAGTVIGVILNLLLPAPLILVCLVVVLTYSAKRTWVKGWKMWQKETHLSERALRNERKRDELQPRTVHIGGNSNNPDDILDLNNDSPRIGDDIAVLTNQNNKPPIGMVSGKGQIMVESSSSGAEDEEEDDDDPNLIQESLNQQRQHQSIASAKVTESFADQMELESNSSGGDDNYNNEFNYRGSSPDKELASNRKSTPDDKSISLIEEEERHSAEFHNMSAQASTDEIIPASRDRRIATLVDLCGGSIAEMKAMAAVASNSPSSIQQQGYGSNTGSNNKNVKIKNQLEQLNDKELNELESLMDDESNRLKQMIFVFMVWCIVFVFAVMKRGLLFHVSSCGADAWVLQFASFPLLLCVTLYISRRAINIYSNKVALGWQPCMGDIEWTLQKGSFYPVIGGLAGLFGGLLGIGGGMIVSPLLLELGVLPRVAAATSAIAVAVTSSSTTIQVYLVHMLRLDYALFFMLVGIVSTYIGQTAVNHMITKYGRHSVVVFAVAGVITLAVALMGIEGIIEIATGEAKFHFSKPC